jgi:N-glycosylase/DNA lyase
VLPPSGDRSTVTALGVVGRTVALVNQEPGGLRVRWQGPAGSPAHLARHLGACEPLAVIEAALARDPVLLRLLPRTSGIAIMRQDPWECLVSYVVSAFNNIPKISLSVERMARRFGEPIRSTGSAGSVDAIGEDIDGGHSPIGWAFPSAERLAAASPAALRACALGYRARYVRDLARMVAAGDVDLARIATMPFDDARAALLDLPGVGEKVADCVLLFAFGRGAAFPVDVWVQRAVERWYFSGRPATPRAIRGWARDRFGPLAGYTQQHLFVGARLLRERVP